MRARFPAILCMTTSSLLESRRPGGRFHELLASSKIIIGDEASIPEPAFVAMVSRLRGARHISTSNAHQLTTHLCSPAPSRLGARAIVTHYKDQQRLMEQEARRLVVALHTAGAVRGREMDIVTSRHVPMYTLRQENFQMIGGASTSQLRAAAMVNLNYAICGLSN
ncbi:unnamed protein product [Haemonchus placei]|uniref:AAA_12 domain-containing protein n=1 Tax=Haemonchus placei TaxID=6290 RepID=A0A0N4WAD2_HAEPC|nr:unnamed protein product [Haemonchus placei]